MQTHPQESQSPQIFETANTVGFQPADNGKRLIAFVIDSIISAVLTKLSAMFLFSGFLGIHPWVAMALQFTLITGLYWVAMPVFFRGTAGKKIMGLRIISADNSMEMSIGQMLLRETIGRFVSILPLFLGYFWILFNPERKSFHDMVAKTKVVLYR